MPKQSVHVPDIYGATVALGASRISASIDGPWYAGSRFKWPADYLPSGCLNIGGGSGECDDGCHIGTWSSAQDSSDNAYFNYCSGCSNGALSYGKYEVWLWNGRASENE